MRWGEVHPVVTGCEERVPDTAAGQEGLRLWESAKYKIQTALTRAYLVSRFCC